MMRRVLLSLLSAPLIAAPAAAADTVLSPAEFQRMSEGKTMYFSRGGQVYGAEQFYTRRRSLWQFSDGQCDHGSWHPKGSYICFVYDQNPDPQCWHFLRRADGRFAARSEGATAEFDILLDHTDDRPLDCKGPDIGV